VPQIRAIFWDVGGVLLTNAWDHVQRMATLDHFHLDEAEFHDRHEMVVSSFERGKITLDEYLDRTVFYRIETNGLRNIFKVFVSSCFVGLRKPEVDIYRMALEITQMPAEQCCFIDDRALNLECATKLGMQTIEMQSLDQLQKSLSTLGVVA
jgi:putative hydrolase of the HAD superfamily